MKIIKIFIIVLLVTTLILDITFIWHCYKMDKEREEK